MSKDHPLYAMSRRFQLDPSPVVFSPTLADDKQAQAEIIELIKAGEPDPNMPYTGQVAHPKYGMLTWMIYSLWSDSLYADRQGMGVRLYDEWWLPDLDAMAALGR